MTHPPPNTGLKQTQFHDDHGDMGNGSLRSAVFSLNDGLTSNSCVIAGIAAATAFNPTHVLVGGFVGMLAGASSMAAGDWVSMSLQAECETEELDREEQHLDQYPEEEKEHFVELMKKLGFSQTTLDAIEKDVNNQPTERRRETQLRLHAQFELGLDPDRANEDPTVGAIMSFCWFLVGGFIPLLPWLLYFSPPTRFLLSLLLSLSALTFVGVIVSRFTSTPVDVSVRRHVCVGTASMILAYIAGLAYHFLIAHKN
eukprot:TRINITY_DN19473_c0_g1_i2.p1 TRINITY_DN19473_c0_g1~~TRINITY_DN19473_c0_g1_i2.p1  ORF type:complete len:273 (+),score=49.79 TRINITY_DN19473_c0_g1_i2:54-821(+)